MFELLVDPNAWLAFATLAALEIVLGIDNLIFISILAGKLPPHQQARARKIGIAAALASRLALLFALAWIMKLTTPLFAAAGKDFSGKDLVLLFGGLFLIYKATKEIQSFPLQMATLLLLVAFILGHFLMELFINQEHFF